MKQRTIRIPAVDVGEVRRGLGLTVDQFAARFGLTPASIRNWEEGITQPYEVAKILLAIIATHPEVVDEVVRISPRAERDARTHPSIRTPQK